MRNTLDCNTFCKEKSSAAKYVTVAKPNVVQHEHHITAPSRNFANPSTRSYNDGRPPVEDGTPRRRTKLVLFIFPTIIVSLGRRRDRRKTTCGSM